MRPFGTSLPVPRCDHVARARGRRRRPRPGPTASWARGQRLATSAASISRRASGGRALGYAQADIRERRVRRSRRTVKMAKRGACCARVRDMSTCIAMAPVEAASLATDWAEQSRRSRPLLAVDLGCDVQRRDRRRRSSSAVSPKSTLRRAAADSRSPSGATPRPVDRWISGGGGGVRYSSPRRATGRRRSRFAKPVGPCNVPLAAERARTGELEHR